MRKIRPTLRTEMDAPGVNTLTICRFLDFLWTRTAEGWRHLLLTTNWDYLLKRELDRMFPEVSPWRRIEGPFHINGTVEDTPDDSIGIGLLPRRSPFLLEDDPPERRTPSLEGNIAFNQIPWRNMFVVVGMSFECETDRLLLRYLNAVRDELPVGESLCWVILNPDPNALALVCNQIQQALPRARIVRVRRKFTEWCRAGFPELESQGVFLGRKPGRVPDRPRARPPED